MAQPISTVDNDRSNFRRRGSKLLSALRSLTNSGKISFNWSQSLSDSILTRQAVSSMSAEPASLPNTRKFPQLFIQEEPTVVHRTQFKSRPSLIEITAEGSTPPSSGADSSSKSFRPFESTGKTSLDSKFSSKSKSTKAITQSSSENKKVVIQGDFGSYDLPLAPIAESESVDASLPVPSKSDFSTHPNNYIPLPVLNDPCALFSVTSLFIHLH
jgi:hypothetical protein